MNHCDYERPDCLGSKQYSISNICRNCRHNKECKQKNRRVNNG